MTKTRKLLLILSDNLVSLLLVVKSHLARIEQSMLSHIKELNLLLKIILIQLSTFFEK